MIIVPAIVLGLIAILGASFFVGFRCTYYFVSFIKSIINIKQNGRIIIRDDRDNLTAGISVIIGIVSAIFAYSFLYEHAQSYSGEVWALLIILGFTASIMSFLVPAITANARQSILSDKGKASKVIDIDYEAQRNYAERKREHYYRKYSATLKRYELLLSMMIDGWINFISKYVLIRKLFSEIYFASLMKLLEKYIRINQIRIIEPFRKERKSVSERVLEFLVGVLEIEGVRIVILLEVMNDLITNTTLAPYVVYLYNIRLDNMLIYLTNTWDETASALIATLDGEKKISLLPLDTMMAEIKKRSSYLHYLKNVVVQNNMH